MALKKRIMAIMLIAIIICVPIKSSAICNTIQVTGDVAAVRLTLSDGRVLNSANMSKDYTTITEAEAQTSVKDTNIIFIVDTSRGMRDELDDVKDALKDFSNDIYNNAPYSYANEKLKMSFIGFDYVTGEDAFAGMNRIDWTSNSGDCEEKINELKIDESGINLEDACNLAQNSLSEFGRSNNNETMTQCIIVISNGLDDLKINGNRYDTDDRQIQRASTILGTLSKDEMVLIQGISMKNEENLERLYQYINQSGAIAVNSQVEGPGDMKDILKNTVLEETRDRAVNSKTIKPYTDLRDGAVTPDTIMLFVDNELMQGATLEIEYVFQMSVWVYSGNVYALVDDYVGRNLSYDDDHRLLTDPSRRNSDFGWTVEASNQGEYQYKLQTRFDPSGSGGTTIRGEKRLVVSTLITTDTFEDDGYKNKSVSSSYYKNTESNSAIATRENEAMKVVIIPPTGEDERFEKYWYWIVLAFILAVSATFIEIKRKVDKDRIQETKEEK